MKALPNQPSLTIPPRAAIKFPQLWLIGRFLIVFMAPSQEYISLGWKVRIY